MLGVINICFGHRKEVGIDLEPSDLKNLHFIYQPYNAPNSNCTFEFKAETNNYLVLSDKHQFQVHFFFKAISSNAAKCF
jgi:hypothetical protein